MLENFSDRARTVMSLSRKAAQRMNSEFIGTEHLLLSIMEESACVGARALKLLKVDPNLVREEIERQVKPSTAPTSMLASLPFTPRVKRVIELAGEEMGRAGAKVLSTEHLLLGLLAEREGIAAIVLTKFNVGETVLRKALLDVLGPAARQIVAPPVMSSEEARSKLAAIQERIMEPRPGPCPVKIWIFKDQPWANQVSKGFLMIQGVKVYVSETIQMEGVPFDKLETIASSIAKECGAFAYLVEPYGIRR